MSENVDQNWMSNTIRPDMKSMQALIISDPRIVIGLHLLMHDDAQGRRGGAVLSRAIRRKSPPVPLPVTP